MHKRIIRRAVAAAAIAGMTGLGLAAASSAAMAAPGAVAGVSATPHFTQAGANATAGYFTSPISSADEFTHIEGFFGSNGSTSLENLTAVPTPPSSLGTGLGLNASGIGLCNQSNADAIRLGSINLGSGMMDVVVYEGNMGAAESFSDPCANGSVGTDGSLILEATLLTSVPISDSIDGQILTDTHHSFAGCSAGQAEVAAQDLTANSGVWKSECVSANGPYDEADAGVIGDTQAMSPPAGTFLSAYAHLGLTEGNAGHMDNHGSFQANPNWTAFPVIATSNGLSSGTTLLDPQLFANDHFLVNSGVPGVG